MNHENNEQQESISRRSKAIRATRHIVADRSKLRLGRAGDSLMSPETLITILSFAVAIYALLPLERALDLKIKFAWYDILVVISATILVLYILYLPVLQKLGWTITLGPWRWGFNASLTTFTIILAVLGWVVVRLRFGGLSRRRIHSFSRLATQLLYQRKNGELAEMLNRYLPQLMKIYENRYRVVRLRNWLLPPTWKALMHRGKKIKERPAIVRYIAPLARLLPAYEGSRDSARQTVHRILLSDNFVKTIAASYPYQAMDILNYDIRESEGFQDKWFQFSLDDPNSVVYTEIEHNQLMSMGVYHRYQYQPENRCLFSYFGDVRNAERLKLYRAIGDYLCAEYGRRRRSPTTDRFNQPLDRYAETEIWRCPAYAVLRLFDYMISESLYQGIPWHMWLHYLQTFADKIVINLSPHDDVNLEAEFPTPYHYQLYEIVDLLCQWTTSAQDLPDFDSDEARDRAIPMQSVIALGQVINAMLLATSLEDQFTSYMVEVVVGRADDWRSVQKLEPYRQTLITNLAKGGRDWGVPAAWPGILRQHVAMADVVRYHQTQRDINNALDEHWQ